MTVACQKFRISGTEIHMEDREKVWPELSPELMAYGGSIGVYNKKKSSKTAQKRARNRKPHTKPSKLIK